LIELNPQSGQQEVLETAMLELREQLREHYLFSQALSDEELRCLIEEAVFRWTSANIISTDEKLTLINRLYYSFRGLDVLQPLLEDASISEIMINNEQQLFIEREGVISKLPLQFESRERLENLIQQIVAPINRTVNEASPIVDARLADGSRVSIVLPPIALRGPCVTIRKFPHQPLTMDALLRKGALSHEAAVWLKTLVQAKYNIFISGGTGSGKTTFLNVLSGYIPRDERIITIEDAAELQLREIDNLVALETRNANTEGKGEISIRELIRASLRMRPNRIIVGEVRGQEALDMLQAMNTGHEGSMSTGHSNNVADMLSRLEMMVLSGNDLPLKVVRGQLCAALDIMIHLTRFADRSRGIYEISQVIGMESDDLLLQPLFQYDSDEPNRQLRLKRTAFQLHRTEKLKLAGLSLD
jgi:pilus assembly protein CpaF